MTYIWSVLIAKLAQVPTSIQVVHFTLAFQTYFDEDDRLWWCWKRLPKSKIKGELGWGILPTTYYLALKNSDEN